MRKTHCDICNEEIKQTGWFQRRSGYFSLGNDYDLCVKHAQLVEDYLKKLKKQIDEKIEEAFKI